MSDPGQWKGLVQLRRILVKRLDDGELRTLCFDLDVDYDVLAGIGKSEKVRELLGYLARREQIPRLLQVGRETRPDIPWDFIGWNEQPPKEENVTLAGRLGEERAHLLSELYAQAVDAHEKLRAWTYQDMPIGLAPERVDEVEVLEHVRDLASLARKSRIYLDADTRQLVDAAIAALQETAAALERRAMAPDEKESWSAHVAAVDNLFASIPDIITRLEDEIRRILGVD